MNFRIDLGSFRVRTSVEEARRLGTAEFVEETYPLPGRQTAILSVFTVSGETISFEVEGKHFRVGIPRARLSQLLGILQAGSAGQGPRKEDLEIDGKVPLGAEGALEVRVEVDLKSLARSSVPDRLTP